MLKPLTAALALAVLAAAPVAAEPKSSDECLKGAIDLAEAAEEKADLADDKLAKIEELLTKLEGHCEGGQFAEAAAVSKEIEAALAGP